MHEIVQLLHPYIQSILGSPKTRLMDFYSLLVTFCVFQILLKDSRYHTLDFARSRDPRSTVSVSVLDYQRWIDTEIVCRMSSFQLTLTVADDYLHKVELR